MPSKRLEEAMKRTAYSHEKVNRPGVTTGRADEEPKPVPRKPYTKDRQQATEEPARVRSNVYRKSKGPRETTARELNRNRTADDEVLDESGEGQSESRARPSGPKLPPDPFPLQYRDGDPDKEFEGE